MVDPLEELIMQMNEEFDRMIRENNELDRAFQNGTFGQLMQSWSEKDDGDAGDVATEAGAEVVGDQTGGEGGKPEAGEQAV